MKHEEQFPIEPLSAERWQRVEQRLFDPAAMAARAISTSAERERQAPKSWQLGLAVAALALACLLGARALRLADGNALGARHVVVDRWAIETTLGDATLRLEPGAEALLQESEAEGALVVLAQGEAYFSVPSRRGRAPFAVQAGEVRVQVIGTRFRVRRDGERVEVADDEGRVRVSYGSKSTLLQPGEKWSSAHAASAAPDPETPTSATHSAPSSDPQESDRAAQRVPDKAAKHRARRPAPSADDARARFEDAARLEASDPERALRGYGDLAASGSPWAEPALYALGRLTFERGDRARATPILHSYLRRYPRGSNAADVRALLVQLGVPSDRAER